MPRIATGSPRYNRTKKVWEARVSIPGHERIPVAMSGIPACVRSPECQLSSTDLCESCTRAVATAKLYSARVRDRGMVPIETGETWNEWHARYIKVHASLGKLTREMGGAAKKWMDPIATRAIVDVKRDDIRMIRDAMTRAVLAGEISAKRIMNVWSDIVAAPFSRAFTDDDPRYSSVRVGPASANPALGVKPPVTKEQLDEESRERQPMHPREFDLLMRCKDVPVVARRIYAIATFLYARPQELYALRWSDVDWKAREVRIRRKLDVRSGEEKPGTKSDAGIREIPIHEHLMPLLEVMRREAGDDNARMLPLVGSSRVIFEKFADLTRGHVRLAALGRDELVEGSDDLMPFDFRSWRTTGCTWLAMLGTDSYVIALQAGHKSPDTTWASYVKRGPDLRKRYGEPFPSLPVELLLPIAGIGRHLVQGPNRPTGRPRKTGDSRRRGRDSKLTVLRPILSSAESTKGLETSLMVQVEAHTSVAPNATQLDSTQPNEPVCADAHALLGLISEHDVKPPNVIDIRTRRRQG